MKTKRIYATERIKALRTIAKASEFTSSIDKLKPGPAVNYGRESGGTQRENLPHQITNLEWEVEKRGFTVVDVVEEIASGREEQRIGFERAVLTAKDAQAVIVAESVVRFIRSQKPYRQPKCKRELPLSVFEMKRLMAEADGVPLATLVDPDASQTEVRGYESKRGQAGSGNRGGRPAERFPRKGRRLLLIPKVTELRRKGLSVREISHQLNVPSSTVHQWIRHQKTVHPAQLNKSGSGG